MPDGEAPLRSVAATCRGRARPSGVAIIGCSPTSTGRSMKLRRPFRSRTNGRCSVASGLRKAAPGPEMDWFACTPLGAPGMAVSRPERFRNDRFRHFCDMPTVSENVRSSGKTGSDQHAARTTRLTRSRHARHQSITNSVSIPQVDDFAWCAAKMREPMSTLGWQGNV